jgi:hypothetical protein
MLLLGINKNHVEYCKNASCYCKREQLILELKASEDKRRSENISFLERGDPKDSFDIKFDLLRKDNSISMVVQYLEQ